MFFFIFCMFFEFLGLELYEPKKDEGIKSLKYNKT